MGIFDSVKNAIGTVTSNPITGGALGMLTGGMSTPLGGALGLYNQTGGAGGPLGNVLPHASPANAPGVRGTPRAGEGPDINNFTLGQDPNWLNNFANGQAGVSAQGQALNQNAQAVGAQGQGMINAGNQAQNRGAPVTAYNPQVAQLQNQNMQGGQQQYNLANQLNTLANAPEGPSAAQAQLQMGTDQALNSQLAQARSGSGFGESSGAMANAQANSAGIQSNAANQAAMLRAGENQAHRARQLQALGMSGEALGQGRAADLALSGQQIGQGQFNTQTSLAQQGMNDALQQGLINQGLSAQNMGLAGQAQGIGAQNQSNQLTLDAMRAQQAGTMGYEQGLTDIYGMDQAAHDKARELNQQNSTNWVQGVTGGISSLASLAGLSDRRAKKNIQDEDLSRVYRALGGK